MNVHPLNIRAPDTRSSMQIWDGDVCIGLRCEGVRTYLGPPGHVVSGIVMVGEVYETLPGPKTALGHIIGDGSSTVAIRRVIDDEILETKNLVTKKLSRCSIGFLLNTHVCRRVS